MKMTKRDLKILVKECLVEILAEGLSETQRNISESRISTGHQVGNQMVSGKGSQNLNPRKMIADKISFLPSRSEISQRSAISESPIKALAGSLTSDPIMADIFADTARSGAHRNMTESAAGRVNHEQMIASAGDSAAKAMLQSDPTDIFGDSAGKWAALAFAEKIPARS